MGLSTSKAFHAAVSKLIDHIPNALAYVDDIIISSENLNQHLTVLEKVFKTFRKANIKFKREKCRFAFHRLPFLGFDISERECNLAQANWS